MLLASALFAASLSLASNSMSMLGYNLDSLAETDELGGCGWSKCYNCVGKDGKPVRK